MLQSYKIPPPRKLMSLFFLSCSESSEVCKNAEAMIWIYILLFVIIALIVYLIYLVRFWGRTNIELTGDTYTGLNNVLCRILNQDRLKK